jgi:hypothetical protein
MPKQATGLTTWAAFQTYGVAYLGLDDKLYIGNWNGFSPAMSVINNPDVNGAGCNFCPKCLRFPHHPPYIDGYVSNPPNMLNYKLGAKNPPCVMGVPEVVQGKKVEFSVSTNPTNGMLTIETIEKGQFEIIDLLGRVVHQSKVINQKSQIDISQHSAGVCVYQLLVDGCRWVWGSDKGMIFDLKIHCCGLHQCTG